MKHLMIRGDLEQRAKNQHLWNNGHIPKTYFNSEEETINIHVTTLKTYLLELATSKAFEEGLYSFEKLAIRVNELLVTELCSGREFVKIADNFIHVGINCDLIDNNAISRALTMISQLNSFELGTTIYMGELVHVYKNKIPYQEGTN